ncbi:hypothetical protein DS2_19316 [Catenovulum agarivorans DS-2]|uniref:Uncharacterized protein n=1 Tax=Catenovulum agarivorans DS-2 TaxID=1328313 RepID=W7QGK6_9ALTE|nr:hypothetical protein DS2_19316 [Catenovulum agarivorans DS-2]
MRNQKHTSKSTGFKKLVRLILRQYSQAYEPDIKALVRQAKLGASYKVKVLVWKGLANHQYRVLRVVRRLRIIEAFPVVRP